MTRRPWQAIALTGVCTLLLMGFSLLVGPYPIPVRTVLSLLADGWVPGGHPWTSTQETILLDVRLPRILLVVMVGATLSASGAVLQAVFRNPLVSPYLLGVSSGASFGASLAVVALSTYQPALIQASAFVFGFVAVLTASALARILGERNITTIVLAGIVMSSIFSALLNLLQYVATPSQLQTLTLWSMGTFSAARWQHVFQLGPFALGGCAVLTLVSWRMNVLALGPHQSQALGVHPERVRYALIAVVSLMTAVAVSVCGPIGWVGLIVPHLVRMMVGPNNHYVVAGSMVFGAGFLLLIDLGSRTLLPVELPASVLTSLIGGVFFVALMFRAKRSPWPQ